MAFADIKETLNKLRVRHLQVATDGFELHYGDLLLLRSIDDNAVSRGSVLGTQWLPVHSIARNTQSFILTVCCLGTNEQDSWLRGYARLLALDAGRPSVNAHCCQPIVEGALQELEPAGPIDLIDDHRNGASSRLLPCRKPSIRQGMEVGSWCRCWES